ncbi:UpxY family transcription antiterminator [Brumimicrobium oceani]|uniref:Transcriptional elongation/antitermination factor NusG-like protein n=1 Tax=Brumimicrobium oceani TaxID=2100725 RepID=A0A2U2XF20_9FLAO|nr:UpxY family transcription antiterminator [Brumimicrobium oceani]PWH86398.1 transcriptional elongation/antitermination factor NusG-like protein [Brumimicrobium oceani]
MFIFANLNDNAMPWYVLLTKPKSEKKVESRLLQLDVKAYCPTRIERRQWSDRIKKVETPLLPSMILVNLEDKERDIVFEIPGAVRYLFWMGKPAQVSEQEIDVLKEMSENQANVLSVEKIEVGKEVEIDNLGSEKQKGVIKKISGNQCWILLKNLGYVVKLRI